jgi:hypothetical protein
LALQEPRLIFSKRLFTDPRSPRLRNPDQLRPGKRCRQRDIRGSILDADPGSVL